MVVINHGRVIVDDRVANVRCRYFGSKILRIQFQEPAPLIELPGVTLISRSEYELKLEIDTRVTPIPQVIGRILQTAPVADIAVQDPPLEAVIARIYQRAKGGST